MFAQKTPLVYLTLIIAIVVAVITAMAVTSSALPLLALLVIPQIPVVQDPTGGLPLSALMGQDEEEGEPCMGFTAKLT